MNRIGIHSVPRSGSTWLGSIFDSSPKTIYKYQPLFSYRFKDRLSAESSQRDIAKFFKDLAETDDVFLDQLEAKKRGLVPVFPKDSPQTLVYKEVRYHHILNNLLQKDHDIKVVVIVRNPLATIGSWLRAPKEFRPGEGQKVADEWRFAPSKNRDRPEEFNGYEKWKEATVLFEALRDKYPERVVILRYDRMLSDTVATTEKVFDFVGLEFTDQTRAFLKASRQNSNKDPYSVFKTKKKDDAWEEILPSYIIDHIQTDLEHSPLVKYL